MKVLPVLALAALVTMTVVAGAPATEVERDSTTVSVTAPATDVDVTSDKVIVDAPFTGVEVDKRKRRVQIRVPYFSGDISW